MALTLIARNAEELRRISADASLRGASRVNIVAGDLTDTSFIKQTVSAVSAPNTALVAYGSLTDSARADGDAAYLVAELNVNFTSAVLWAQSLAERMATNDIDGTKDTKGTKGTKSKDGSTLAVISSVAGDRGRGSNHAYGAAKAGLTAFCSGLRSRMRERGVHVVTVKPGFIDSPMTAHIAKKGALWATPESIAIGIVSAIDKQRDVVYLPGFWRGIMLIVCHVPEGVFKRLKF